MIKRGVFLISIIFILLLQISLAISITYTYNSVYDQINAVVYKISDNSFVNSYSSGSTNKIIINYDTSDPNLIYNTYHYKQGYLPYLFTWNQDYATSQIKKQSNCQTPINSVSIPDSATQNQPFIITVNLGSINNVFVGLTIPSFIPSQLNEYYKADTNVKLYLDNNPNPILTQPIKISTTGNNLQFTPSISIAGIHNIKIVTEVTDDQCSNAIPDENIDTITVIQSQQPPTCTDECNTIGQTRCYSTTLRQTCTLGANGCNYWSNTSCSITNQVCSNSNCVTSATCTPLWICSEWSSGCNDQQMQARTCSDTKYCNNLTDNPTETRSCTTQTLQNQNQSQVTQTCVPNPICNDWSECDEGMQTRTCLDQSHCGLDEYQESKNCNETESQTISLTTKEQSDAAKFNERMNTTINEMLSRISEGIQELIKSNKYYFIISFGIIALIVILILAYVGAHKEKILKPRTKIIKSDKKAVKINDLMLSVIESLDSDERELCYLIVENEGVSQEELQKKSSLTKIKLEIALTKLERRQVIKKREGDSPRVFFNDWLK